MDKESQNVIITNVKIPFTSLVGFMVKSAIASIPAIIIFSIIMTGLFIGLGIVVEMFGLQEMLSFMTPQQ